MAGPTSLAGDAGASDAVLWAALRDGGAGAARAALAQRYLPFARIMAGKLYAGRTLREVEFDEYLQWARVGLLEAIDRYDHGRGYKFETYAASRISGAILNGLASYSEIHEQVAARKRIVATRLALLRERQPAAPAGGELFACLAELAIGMAVGFALDDSGMYRDAQQEGEYRDNSYVGLELRQLRQRLQALVEQLPARQRQVIVAHYLQQMTFDDVARMLNLSPGRIAQLHREGLEGLRSALHGQAALDWSG